MRAISVAFWVLTGCTPARPEPPKPGPLPHPPASSPSATASASSQPEAPAPPPQREPDGNDERAPASFELGAKLRFEKVGRHWGALHRICDFAVDDQTLLMAHATRPLGFGGATITRYRPDEKTPFAMAFDWNRSGEPDKGGGAGQGFLRIRRFANHWYVPDADPPYLGLGLARGMAEGYVFVSEANARFASVRNPGHLPPASALVLPGALHVFDVARYQGTLLVSTGAVVPAKRPTASPGTLFAEDSSAKHWAPVYTYAHPKGAAARLGYMTRFRDRLYVAISALEDGDPNEYVEFTGSVSADHARVVRVTDTGAHHTLRWYADGGRLYWISLGGNGSELRVTSDGKDWKLLTLPANAGGPTDVLRVGKSLVVLAENGLYRLDGGIFHELARVTDAKSPFRVDDVYCAAPLVAFRGALYAGGQRRGDLHRLQSDAGT